MTSLSLDACDFRLKVQEFLLQELPRGWSGVGALSTQEREKFLPQWREKIRSAGYLAYGFPSDVGGGGFDMWQQTIIQQEFIDAGAPLSPLPNDFSFLKLLGPTLLRWGSKAQKDKFFPAAFSGEHQWAQGYSEPDAGSDLFSLATTATRDGADWIINGQKIWTTAGSTANWIFALCRTDTTASKSKGISFILVPVDQPGVDVRPLRTMTGDAEYCEVFFTDARTSVENTVGPVNSGAEVAMTLLGFERGSGAMGVAASHRVELDRMAELIRRRGLQDDPVVQDRFGWCVERVEALWCLATIIAETMARGESPGAESSLLKIYSSEYHKCAMELVIDVLGPEALVRTGEGSLVAFGSDPRGVSTHSRSWLNNYYMSRAATIYGGSSQIQRNTISERLLGLPRDARPTKS